MVRQIDVSTSVYAAIWAERQEGEETEDQILKRLLDKKILTVSAPTPVNKPKSGFYDARNQVEFPPGFRISRKYKGKDYSAEARDGAWVRLDNGKRFRSLNQLNRSICAGPENVWDGCWTYVEQDGRIRSINRLRNA